MKAFLMFKDRDFDLKEALPWNEEILTQDLELNTLFEAMALGDEFLFEVAKRAVFFSVPNDRETILYRQDILKDCLKNPSLIRDIYDIAVEAINSDKKIYFGYFFSKYPGDILRRSIEVLHMLVSLLRKLRNIAEEHAPKFYSEGFKAFFTMLKSELDEEYFATIENHLEEMKCREGVLLSAELGKGNKGKNYILRKSQNKKRSWIERLFAKKPLVYTYNLHPRDENGFRALSEIKDRGLNLAANALAQSTDHILSFFNMLRTELAFYIGCLNLYAQLAQMEAPISFPLPIACHERKHSFKELYDVCLALTMKRKVVGNDMDADGKGLVLITGANQGGKSTFLRSIGLAQLMMQCGMFVAADSFCANICDGLFTHYKREEDPTLKSGKLDEELSRMSDIINKVTPNSIILFNESFSATNEREGSEIARQIVSALIEKGIKVFYVTHLYELARRFYEAKDGKAIFLKAERLQDGTRTFKLREGQPIETSYGVDLYGKIFGAEKQSNVAG